MFYFTEKSIKWSNCCGFSTDGGKYRHTNSGIFSLLCEDMVFTKPSFFTLRFDSYHVVIFLHVYLNLDMKLKCFSNTILFKFY